MTVQLCSLNSSYQHYWDDELQQEHWTVFHQLSERLTASINPSHSELIFSPLYGVMEVWHPSKRHAVVDRFSDRLKKSQFTGAELAIDYLHEKYSHNLAAATIASAGGTILSFLLFLTESEVNIHQVTNRMIDGYVERDQDNRLKTGAIRTKPRALYAFIRFLVDRGILPYEILHKKIRMKPEERLPKAIPAQDIKSLLAVIDHIRDRALILLLLRTG